MPGIILTILDTKGKPKKKILSPDRTSIQVCRDGYKNMSMSGCSKPGKTIN
jgi:hypothetical protein